MSDGILVDFAVWRILLYDLWNDDKRILILNNYYLNIYGTNDFPQLFSTPGEQ